MGSVKPKFPTTDKSHAFETINHESVTLLCPAQAYPVPSIRYSSLFFFHVLEPMSTAIPKVSSKSKYDVLEYPKTVSLALICPAQGFPVPSYRFVKGFAFL